MSAPYYQDATVTLHHSDCLDVLRTLPDASVDSVVTDPPYDLTNRTPDVFGCAGCGRTLGGRDGNPDVCPRCGGELTRQRSAQGKGFMSKAWDGTGIAFRPAVWVECLRVLKPGGHLLAFGGTRTSHRLTCAIEDAGFEIRDSIAWLYSQGFPKSLDVSKAIDKAAGAEREVVGSRTDVATRIYDGGEGPRMPDRINLTAPATPDAERWQGWGTAMKPAWENVVCAVKPQISQITVARKPLAGNVAANVLAHGTGALNIDASRVGMSDEDREKFVKGDAAWRRMNEGRNKGRKDNEVYGEYGITNSAPHNAGRWPPNVVLDESQAAVLDAQSGALHDRGNTSPEWSGGGTGETVTPGARMFRPEPLVYGDSGGASRFFFVARGKGDRIETCERVNTAEPSSSQPSAQGDSARSDAAISEYPDMPSPTPSASTSEKANVSRSSVATSTPTTPSTDAKSSPESRQPKPFPTSTRASDAEPTEPTDTTTTTTSPSQSAGSVDPATSPITSSLREPGDLALPIDTLDSRFTYTAKAGSSERVQLPKAGDAGVGHVAHPT